MKMKAVEQNQLTTTFTSTSGAWSWLPSPDQELGMPVSVGLMSNARVLLASVTEDGGFGSEVD